jgi:hypothetical protein
MYKFTFLRSRTCVCVFLCVVLYSVLRRTSLPFTVNLFIRKGNGNTLISYFRFFTNFKRGIIKIVNYAIKY